MHAHTHVLRPLLPRVWGAHTAAPPPFTAWQLFPGSEIQPASRGCRYLISWICHSQCLLLPLAPGSSCQALRSPRKQAEQAAGSLPSAACAPLAHLPSSDSASLQRVNPAVLFPLTSVLPILGHSVLLGSQVRLCHQCPREGQEPRGAADPAQARRLHAGGVGCQRDGGCVVGEMLKLLLLKEKEQMALSSGGDSRSHAQHPSASRMNCDAKRNGMRRTRGQGGEQSCRGCTVWVTSPAPSTQGTSITSPPWM